MKTFFIGALFVIVPTICMSVERETAETVIEGYLQFDFRIERYCERKYQNSNEEYKTQWRKDCVKEMNNDLSQTKKMVSKISDILVNTDGWSSSGQPISWRDLKDKLLKDCVSSYLSDESPRFDMIKICLESKYQQIYSASRYK